VTDVFAELVVLVVDALRIELFIVVDLPAPRTLGKVPMAAVCCARRARLTSRMLIKVRFVHNSVFQVMASQA